MFYTRRSRDILTNFLKRVYNLYSCEIHANPDINIQEFNDLLLKLYRNTMCVILRNKFFLFLNII